MTVRIAERLESEDRIQHRGKNRAESVAAFADVFEQPRLADAQRAFAERLDLERAQALQQAVAAEEKIRPRESRLAPARAEVGLLGAGGVKLVQREFRRQVARGLEVVQDRERDEHRARPRAHLINVEEEPFWKQQHLRRDGRQMLPWELAEEALAMQ